MKRIIVVTAIAGILAGCASVKTQTVSPAPAKHLRHAPAVKHAPPVLPTLAPPISVPAPAPIVTAKVKKKHGAIWCFIHRKQCAAETH